MTKTTGLFTDERCFWHSGGNYAFMSPVGGMMQPTATGGLPENPETKRRLKNLAEVTGLLGELNVQSAAPVTMEDLVRVHPADFLATFKSTAEAGGGETGMRAPYGPDGYDIACLSAGLAKAALFDVLDGKLTNAYALSRPPGHHCLPDWQNGFCLLANIAIAIEAALASDRAKRIAVLDWDVHHGNGTEAIFYDRADVLTISMHQDRNYPMDTGAVADRGNGAGEGHNLNIPIPPGAGHNSWKQALNQLALPAIKAFQPDAIIVACGFDAAAFDPLGRMLCTAETFADMTSATMDLANDICGGKLVMVHEGGYSETYVPFCGHNVLQSLAGSKIHAPDPYATTLEKRQPNPAFKAWIATQLDDMAKALS
ncbi:MAG: class II histone deacetylase [Boseongicola sp.]|nr:MAG: class II histone deacetylase [Boseongicola sp.]